MDGRHDHNHDDDPLPPRPPPPPAQPAAEIGGLRLLQDLDQYLHRNGLASAQDHHDDNDHTLDQRELAKRIKNEERYKEYVFGQFFEQDDEEDLEKKRKDKEERERLEHKQRVLNAIAAANSNDNGATTSSGSSGSSGPKMSLSIVTPKETIHNLSLYDFVDKCDTIYALVKSDQWSNSIMKSNNSDDDSGNFSNKMNKNGAAAADDDGHNVLNPDSSNRLSFSLSQFDHSSIQEFIQIVQGSKSISQITPESIIECCHIAHYLQANDEKIFQPIVDIIQSSIDSNNCAPICILADQLNIPSLFHSSMEYVMDSLDNIQADCEIWDDFPQSLQHHVITLRNAAKSSIVNRGNRWKAGQGGGDKINRGVWFTSSNEFLGIFSDTLREHKDRLEEAKLRQEQIIQDRITMNQRRGRYAKDVDVYSGDVMDAAIKIEKQEKRVKTLEAFYREQKAIFSRDASSDGIGAYMSPFLL